MDVQEIAVTKIQPYTEPSSGLLYFPDRAICRPEAMSSDLFRARLFMIPLSARMVCCQLHPASGRHGGKRKKQWNARTKTQACCDVAAQERT